ncbi:hypothetical protein ACU8V3_07790 [Cobetia marina]
MIKDYLRTTKPGIIFGNLITVSGGFFSLPVVRWIGRCSSPPWSGWR